MAICQNPACKTAFCPGCEADNGIDEAAILEAIVDQLDGKVWTPDTLDAIAGILRGAGYEIAGPGE